MNKNSSSLGRCDILSLNLKEIRKSLPSSLQTKLIVEDEKKSSNHLNQSVIKPWMLSLSNHVAVSREKVGNELLHHCRHGFILDDPYIQSTRFFVDYHRMHDPALKRYYKSIPVRNRLKKLQLIAGENDAICTHKEFVEYLRYLDTNANYNIAEAAARQSKQKLAEHFRKLTEKRANDSQYTGIFRRKRHITADTKTNAYFNE